MVRISSKESNPAVPAAADPVDPIVGVAPHHAVAEPLNLGYLNKASAEASAASWSLAAILAFMFSVLTSPPVVFFFLSRRGVQEIMRDRMHEDVPYLIFFGSPPVAVLCGIAALIHVNSSQRFRGWGFCVAAIASSSLGVILCLLVWIASHYEFGPR